MKWLKWTAIGLGGLVVLAVAVVTWSVSSESGARWIAGVARNALGEKLEIGAIQGTIAGPLTLTDVHYRDPAAGIEFTVERIAIDMALADLFRTAVHVEDAELSGIEVLLHEAAQPPPAEESRPFSLQPPIDVLIDSLTVNDVVVRSEGELLFDIDTAAFGGRWTDADLAIEQLDVQSPRGEIHFAGRVDQVDVQDDVYAGEGRGRFRWTVGDKTYAGTLNTGAGDRQATLELQLTSPLKAQLDLQLEQSEALPWQFTLEAPRFDPREQLLPDTGMQSLAASLNGKGSLSEGMISGQLVIDGEPLHLDPVRFTRSENAVGIKSVVRIGDTAGELRATAKIQLERDPWFATVQANWRDVEVPAVWAGQELHTRGQLDLSGNTQTFTAEGTMALGPPGRIADIALKIEGSPQAVQIEQFDIVQKPGRLAASGKIDLQPVIAWNVIARATDFDPGAFAAAWSGNLDFEIKSEGRLMDNGPQATLQLANLTGRLRGRDLSGEADLVLTPQPVLAGTLSLNSGSSELRFRGERGDAIDATIALDIASLNDWLPDSGGELNGRFAVRGRWPELAIEGEARGRKLHAANVRIETLELNVDIDNPGNPSGSARIDLSNLAVAGFEFDTVLARASGTPDAHQLELSATGEPLGADLALQGARTPEGWSGSLQRLLLDVEDAVRLALREPVRIVYAKNAIDVSQACLADGDIQLCVRGSMQPDGALQANYSMAAVPLALANVLAPADSPVKLAGMIEGRGEVRRTAQGTLFGEAQISSPSGRIWQQAIESDEGVAEDSDAETLFSYEDLRIAANLSGSEARASLNAQLQENGSLSGEVTLQGLGESATGITGNLSADIPDLAPIAVFAPQLVNVQGRAEARASVTGTLQQPEISAQLNATELAADIPAAGLQLKNGRLRAAPAANGEIAISGAIESGDGRIEFDGLATTDGTLDMDIRGDRFLAADIPGARVIVTPDLTFFRAEERMTLSGEVLIPTATVNLQKLPRGERVQQASSDVVVIDAKTVDDEIAKVPLYADVTVIIGEEVELVGFGLEADVSGRLTVHESPGEPTTGSGQIGVAGTYKAYGQDLTIQQGQLLFAGTPLDNPRLSVVATRAVGEVTAGLRITGSAQSPELNVFSDPPMGQANALSYLVAGKPLDDIGSEAGEGDAVQTAARSLGTAAGGLLAKNIGRRLGVDEVGVKDSEMIGGAALTVGQYLSPRVYLSYGIGLFEPGDVVTLRYKLSDDLAIQAQRGPEGTRAGIEYRIEK